MEDKFGSERAWLLALVIGLLIGIGLGWFTFPYLFPLFKNVGLAAWVQALGSIAAIFAGFYLNSRNQKVKEIGRLQNKLEALESVIKNFSDGTTLITERKASAEVAPTRIVGKKRAEHVERFLGGYKRILIPESVDIMSLKDAFDYLDNDSNSDLPFSIQQPMKRAISNIKKIIDDLEKAKENLYVNDVWKSSTSVRALDMSAIVNAKKVIALRLNRLNRLL